ncbi:MAG: acyl-CoA transferase [Gammaproteobacteria bacterium]|nr:acyl-CoA transferase [Gammaproteobacteria bacterium]
MLEALRARLGSIPSVTVQRNTAVPETVPASGLIVLRDGDAGEPEQALGGFADSYYSHRVEIEVYVSEGDVAARDAAFDALLQEIGIVLEADPTLGGLAFGMTYGRPDPTIEPASGALAFKTGVIELEIDYEAPSPLG